MKLRISFRNKCKGRLYYNTIYNINNLDCFIYFESNIYNEISHTNYLICLAIRATVLIIGF